MTGGRFGLWVAVAFATGALTATAIAEEPHLVTAMNALTHAHDALAATRDNKGGHPAAAQALIAKAQAEIQAVAP
ncbi:hypothetical protein [Acidisoma silvae]|uniref:Uncharacterized protein n=1 Tax=Acidisoma silvae TaxID=2802396 RepID=A0A964DYN2_9PROT|nr:hypothetical protein [Acidisoma silvae]MCB8875237.1 hypothetical protein [Acidisoma silvae]